MQPALRSSLSENSGPFSPAARVLAGARAHFFLHGFRGVTMDDLAAELRMSKKTLYAHFPSKTALLDAVTTDKLDQVEADLRRLTDQTGLSFPERLQALLACVRGHTEELQPAFLRDIRAEAPEIFTRLQERRRQLVQRYFGQLLGEGQRAGAVRMDVSVELLVEILVGAVNTVMASALPEELSLTPKSAFTQITSVFLEGALVRREAKT